jgi:hypothetical protein
MTFHWPKVAYVIPPYDIFHGPSIRVRVRRPDPQSSGIRTHAHTHAHTHIFLYNPKKWLVEEVEEAASQVAEASRPAINWVSDAHGHSRATWPGLVSMDFNSKRLKTIYKTTS